MKATILAASLLALSLTSADAAPTTAPALAVAPSQLDFGPQFIGSISPAKTLILTSGSDVPLTLLITGLSGTFEASPRSCELPRSGSCAISVTFTPKQFGRADGALTLGVTGGGNSTSKVVALSGSGSTRCADGPGVWSGLSLRWWVVVVVLGYLAAVLFVRWNMIVLPTRALLRKEIDSVRRRGEALTGGGGSTAVQQADTLLDKADALIPEKCWLFQSMDILFWTRGQEMAGWKYVHQAEIQLIPLLPAESVQAALERVEADLREITANAPAEALAGRIHQALAATAPSPGRLKALLAEGCEVVTEHNDQQFAQMSSWHNKTTWLLGCGLFLITVLSAALQHEVLFLMGALGGLLSRLTRALRREALPTDYGAYWTSLFLSPVAGALAGWSGVLLIIVGTDLNLLGSALKIDWCNPYTPTALGAALLLGVSERLFNDLVGKLEDGIGGAQNSSTAPTGASAGLAIATQARLPAGILSLASNAAAVASDVPSYAQALEAIGGLTPYAWALTEGDLPPGLELDPLGTITGTPTSAGEWEFTLRVTDAAGKSATRKFKLPVTT